MKESWPVFGFVPTFSWKDCRKRQFPGRNNTQADQGINEEPTEHNSER